MTEIQQIQEIVTDWFEEYDDKTVSDFICSFVYMQPTKNKTISLLIEKFLDDNGLKTIYVNYLSDIRRKNEGKLIFNSCSHTDRNMLIDINTSLLSLSFNRLRTIVDKPVSNKNFNFLKKELLSIYECLNRSENYIYSEEEDFKIVTKIQKMKNE
jgi:hypothetical protein